MVSRILRMKGAPPAFAQPDEDPAHACNCVNPVGRTLFRILLNQRPSHSSTRRVAEVNVSSISSIDQLNLICTYFLSSPVAVVPGGICKISPHNTGPFASAARHSIVPARGSRNPALFSVGDCMDRLEGFAGMDCSVANPAAGASLGEEMMIVGGER
jgi:hypothetical protein